MFRALLEERGRKGKKKINGERERERGVGGERESMKIKIIKKT